ncbi:MAG: alpha/beta fold hydrolase [Planctomycetaceae bacterium]
MRRQKLITLLATLSLASFLVTVSTYADELGEEGYADSNGVKIHYVTAGEGPLLVMIHGFPDYWYTWREQMPALAAHFKVVAIDQRGYNKGDNPEELKTTSRQARGRRRCGRRLLMQRRRSLSVMTGGMVAWSCAMSMHPTWSTGWSFSTCRTRTD